MGEGESGQAAEEPGHGAGAPAEESRREEREPRCGEREEDPASERGARRARLAVRAMVVAAAGVMATGFLDWRAGLLVVGLVTLSHVLLATVGPRIPALWGKGRLLRSLHSRGYHILAEGPSRYLLIGAGGIYLLELRVWRRPVLQVEDEWRIGGVPAARVLGRLGRHALRLERVLRPSGTEGGLKVVPVVVVAAGLSQPVVHPGKDEAILARPRGALRYLAERPEVLGGAEAAALAEKAAERRG